MNIESQMFLIDGLRLDMEDRPDWANLPSSTTDALIPLLDAIELESKYIHILKTLGSELFYHRFFGIPEETDSFVEFMFDLSLTHEIVDITVDNDPCGERNLLLVVRESTDTANVDGDIIDAILKKFDDAKGLV